jgi:hypothetical protein
MCAQHANAIMPLRMTTTIQQLRRFTGFSTAALLLSLFGCATITAEPEAELQTVAPEDVAEAAGELAVVEPAPEPETNPEPETAAEPAPPVAPVSRPAVAPAAGDVVWIQRRLKDLGYYMGPIDGDAGGATRRAIREYQADQGLTTTGLPTAELQDFMWRNGG